jgi:hypothetical protein
MDTLSVSHPGGGSTHARYLSWRPGRRARAMARSWLWRASMAARWATVASWSVARPMAARPGSCNYPPSAFTPLASSRNDMGHRITSIWWHHLSAAGLVAGSWPIMPVEVFHPNPTFAQGTGHARIPGDAECSDTPLLCRYAITHGGDHTANPQGIIAPPRVRSTGPGYHTYRRLSIQGSDLLELGFAIFPPNHHRMTITRADRTGPNLRAWPTYS